MGYRGVDKDVTKRKLLEDNLKLTNEKLEKLVELRTREMVESSGLNNQIIENLGLAMVTTTLEGKLLSINPEARRMLELSIHEKLENQYLISQTIEPEEYANPSSLGLIL